MIHNVPFERPDSETVAALYGLPVAAVYDALMAMGVRRCFVEGVRPITPRRVMVGPAVTLHYLPMREDLLPAGDEERISWADFQALEFAQSGDVLVFDVGGLRPAAVLGDVFTTRLKVRGATGVIIDGYVRDVKELVASGLVAFSRGSNAVPVTAEVMPAALNVPVQCGGVTVMPGDLVVSDDDGVVIVPRKLAAEVAEHAREKETLEAFIREQLTANPDMSTGTLYRRNA